MLFQIYCFTKKAEKLQSTSLFIFNKMQNCSNLLEFLNRKTETYAAECSTRLLREVQCLGSNIGKI